MISSCSIFRHGDVTLLCTLLYSAAVLSLIYPELTVEPYVSVALNCTALHFLQQRSRETYVFSSLFPSFFPFHLHHYRLPLFPTTLRTAPDKMAAVDRLALLDQLRGIRPPPIHSCHGDLFRALLPSARPSSEVDEELQGQLHAAVAACCDAGRLDVDKAVPTLSADPREAKAAEDFLDFASSSPLLRVTWSGMPGIVLPEGVAEASLADVKASPPRYESDDTLYCSQPEIRQRVARGNSVLKVTYDDGRCESRMVLQSFRKFTGSLGDEDDDLKMAEGQHAADAAARSDKKTKPAMAPAAQSALRWKQFFLQPTSNVTSAVVMAKANGEAAHFSALRFGVSRRR